MLKLDYKLTLDQKTRKISFEQYPQMNRGLNSIVKIEGDNGLSIINVSRGIIYAGNGDDFAERSREEAQKLQQEMAVILAEAGI